MGQNPSLGNICHPTVACLKAERLDVHLYGRRFDPEIAMRHHVTIVNKLSNSGFVPFSMDYCYISGRVSKPPQPAVVEGSTVAPVSLKPVKPLEQVPPGGCQGSTEMA